MAVLVTDLCQDIDHAGIASDDLIDWRQRYEGVLVVAYLDGKAVAGISGPWPVEQYALTWWDRPVPARQLELFDSLAAAQRRVEEWAWRMRTIGALDRHPANDPVLPEANESSETAQPSWLARLRHAISVVTTPRAPRISRNRIEALRYPPLDTDALRGVHFAAIE